MALQTYPKRLIEVDLPIRRISEHARREKSIRHGHISTLHIWWARRPLAACRAVLCAALWPDPCDDLCPDSFKDEAKQQMLAWATKNQHLMSGESLKNFNQITQNPDHINRDEVLRHALLDFIADFANWDNSTKQEYLETCRCLTLAAHEALGGISGTRPLVADPFAGGGSIPLEALRVGADAFASDLNPVAVLLNKTVLEYIPMYGNARIEMQGSEGNPIAFDGLAEALRYWGKWIKQEAENQLGKFYPKDSDGSIPIAYLWARTIISEAPDDGTGIPVEVPLIRTLWLAKKGKKTVALRWLRDENGQVQTETVQISYTNGQTLSVQRPLLELFEPMKASEVEAGTVAKGSATCPVTGYTTPVASVRKQLKSRKGGANDARLFAVVLAKPGQQGRFYRIPDIKDFDAITQSKASLKNLESSSNYEFSLVPDEDISLNEIRRISVPLYGIAKWGDAFSVRQLLTMAILTKSLRYLSETTQNKPLVTILALALSRYTNQLNSFAKWHTSRENIDGAFSRQALGMIWDFPEANPLSDSTGNLTGALDWVLNVIDQPANVFALSEGTANQNSSTEHPLPSDSIQCFFTDPPYYDAVPYSHLADFFYVWLKRFLSQDYPNMFTEALTPKELEIVVDRPHELSTSTKGIAFYEEHLQMAFGEGRRILRPDSIGTIVFASKTTSSWEAILKATLQAGWIITASWPIDTEMESRVSAQGQARLASSVHLVCRPREHPDGSIITDYVGDWREVLAELPHRIHEWMPRLALEGVVGADAIFACLGPALEVFSRYSSVEKASGEEVSLSEYLEHVWAAVAKEALNMIFEGADTSGFEEDARLTAMWLWTLNSNVEKKITPSSYPGGGMFPGANAFAGPLHQEIEEDDTEKGESSGSASRAGFSLEYDAARKIAQGLGAHLDQLTHLVEVKGSDARLLPVGERGTYLFGKQTTVTEEAKGKKKKTKSKQANIFELFDSSSEDSGDAPVQSFAADSIAPDFQISAGKSILDRIHQGMILFATGQGEMLRRFLVEQGIGRDERFWRLAQALSALYPQGTDEKRWVDGVLARKKGLGF